MSNVKRGDVVILTLGGRDYKALVHQVTRTESSHLGEDGEPALHLSYVPDDPIVNGKPKVMPIGYIPPSEMIYAVVHASHKFSRAYMKEHNLRDLPQHDLQRTQAEAEIRNRRGAGEWREFPVLPEDTAAEDEDVLVGRGRDLPSVSLAAPGEVARVEGFTGGPFTSDAPQNSEPKE